MVEHDLIALATPGGVGTIVDILYLTAPEADVSYDDVVALAEVDGIITEGDAR